MTDKTRTYESDGIQVHFDPTRCIHAARCVDGLATVFDRERRPWIDLTQANADDVASVIVQCPTGALHFERRDGGLRRGEIPPWRVGHRQSVGSSPRCANCSRRTRRRSLPVSL